MNSINYSSYIIGGITIFVLLAIIVYSLMRNAQYRETKTAVLKSLGLNDWLYITPDDKVVCKSKKAVDNYSVYQYFKEDRTRLEHVLEVLSDKKEYKSKLETIISFSTFDDMPMYPQIKQEIIKNMRFLDSFTLHIEYISPTGKKRNDKLIRYTQEQINALIQDPSQLMSKSEYNQLLKAENKAILEEKQHKYYQMVNKIVDAANKYNNKLVIDGDKEKLDQVISSLFDRTVNSIKKIKNVNSDEWTVIKNYILRAKKEVETIIQGNLKIIKYYKSQDFLDIKNACKTLMQSQKDFNDYISEKANSISKLFGTRVVRNETINNDEYNYIRPYKKVVTPFTAEVSKNVFASAENSPIEYIVKYFYPNKDMYPEQIQKLQTLVEELETLKDAKRIIDNYKKEYSQYIKNVPSYIMENDEDGFFQKLGFANISERVLTIEYKFCYTSDGGMAQRAFTVPMTEETIIDLINALQNKLTMKSFTKEQRALMTSKMRESIKKRDNYTCCHCGNSIHKEPNLLLEIDHVIPVSKGGRTEENNLQTLCWKCNRSKSDKILPSMQAS